MLLFSEYLLQEIRRPGGRIRSDLGFFLPDFQE
jgi:hypothetical protein